MDRINLNRCLNFIIIFALVGWGLALRPSTASAQEKAEKEITAAEAVKETSKTEIEKLTEHLKELEATDPELAEVVKEELSESIQSGEIDLGTLGGDKTAEDTNTLGENSKIAEGPKLSEEQKAAIIQSIDSNTAEVAQALKREGVDLNIDILKEAVSTGDRAALEKVMGSIDKEKMDVVKEQFEKLCGFDKDTSLRDSFFREFATHDDFQKEMGEAMREFGQQGGMGEVFKEMYGDHPELGGEIFGKEGETYGREGFGGPAPREALEALRDIGIDVGGREWAGHEITSQEREIFEKAMQEHGGDFEKAVQEGGFEHYREQGGTEREAAYREAGEHAGAEREAIERASFERESLERPEIEHYREIQSQEREYQPPERIEPPREYTPPPGQ